MPLIEINGLRTCFHTENGVVRAVDGVDFSIEVDRAAGLNDKIRRIRESSISR